MSKSQAKKNDIASVSDGCGPDGVYDFSPELCDTVKNLWEMAGEIGGGSVAVGTALFEGIIVEVKLLGKFYLFVTPVKVIAFQFTRVLEACIFHAHEEDFLEETIYNLCMRHINYVSPETLLEFKDMFMRVILETVKQVLEEEYTEDAHRHWKRFLAYLGEHLYMGLKNNAARILTLRSAWNECKKLENKADRCGGFGDALYFNLSVMSAAITALIKQTRQVMARNFNSQFDIIISSITDPNFWDEEMFVLGARHITYGVQEEHFPVFKQAILVTLRSLLPNLWNWEQENAWNWVFDKCKASLTTNLSNAIKHKPILEADLAAVIRQNQAELGHAYMLIFFEINPISQDYFNKPNALFTFLVSTATRFMTEFYETPTKTANWIRALGIRHIKYGIPPDLFPTFGAALIRCFSGVFDHWNEDHTEAWMTIFLFTSKVMERVIYAGTTLVTRALVRDCVPDCIEALDSAPRSDRVRWLLEVDVSGSKVSPFYWSIQDARHKFSEYMLTEILTIRADRAKYFCGKDLVFKIHPDLVGMLSRANPDLLWILLDGLMWESSKVQDGKRKVNYYIENMYGDPGKVSSYETPAAHIKEAHNVDFFVHPLIRFILDLQWEQYGLREFMQLQLAAFAKLLFFLLGFELLSQTHGKVDGAVICRILCCVMALVIFVTMQAPIIYKQVRENLAHKIRFTRDKHKVVKLEDGTEEMRIVEGKGVLIPYFFTETFHVIRLVVNFLFVLYTVFDPKWGELGWDLDSRADVTEPLEIILSILMFFLVFEFLGASLQLLKLKEQMQMVSGFFGIFLLTALLLIFTFGMAMVLAEPPGGFGHYAKEYKNLGTAMVSLLSSNSGLYHFITAHHTSQLSLFYILFVAVGVLVLLRQIIALFVVTSIQNSRDIQGRSILCRAEMLMDLAFQMGQVKRQKIWESMDFSRRIEFDEGDLGMAGGLQVEEIVGIGRSVHDREIGERVVRYAGECDDKEPWPRVKDKMDPTMEMVKRVEGIVENMRKEFRGIKKSLLDNSNFGSSSIASSKSDSASEP